MDLRLPHVMQMLLKSVPTVGLYRIQKLQTCKSSDS